MHRSLYRPIAKNEVVAEYTRASRSGCDYTKAKWESQDSMLNRFRLAISLVGWEGVTRWLDVGCGTGVFFALAEESGHRFQEIVGVDITPEILFQARSRTYNSPSRFLVADLEAIPVDLSGFDLITLVGVLQQCGTTPEQALRACIERLGPEGRLFLTTKHLGWSAFTSGRLTPEPGHSWFDYGELSDILEELGVEIVRSGGFLPREGEVVGLEQSHTLFVLGSRRTCA